MENISLEKILAFKSLKNYLLKKDWIEIGKKLGINIDKINQRLWGKTLEDYFFLVANCYESTDSLLAFNEAISKFSNTASPDGIIVFKDGNRFLFEVKGSITESIFKLSVNRLKKQRALANALGMELFYMVNLSGYWGMYSAEFMERNARTIEHPKDLQHSVFDQYFDSKLIKIPKGLKLYKHFTKNKDWPSFFPDHTEFGSLIAYAVGFGDIIVPIQSSRDVTALTSIDLQLSMMSDQKILQGEITEVVHECNHELFIYDYSLVLDTIIVTVSDVTQDYFDTSTIISQVLDKQLKDVSFSNARLFSLDTIQNLIMVGIPFEVMKASEVKTRNYKV